MAKRYLKGMEKLNSTMWTSYRLDDTKKFHVTEAYKLIRTNLLFTLSDADKKVVLVSSAEPDAGKSISCANLAISMAQTGARVLLIDADMRRAVQHRIFGIPKGKGISQLLGGFCGLEDAIVHDKSSLDIITAGQQPPNPVELLASKSMNTILEKLSEQYDYIFIDTPPVNILSDALVLADKVAGVVLIARQKQTTYDILQKAIDSIRKVDGVVLGTVINDVEEKNKPYKSYSTYYSSYYGSYEPKKAAEK